MGEIIDFKDRLKKERETSDEKVILKKREMVKRFFQCARCVAKCAMCGAHPESEELRPVGSFSLCEFCYEDYQDYKSHLGGAPAKGCWWQNQTWLNMWRSWLDFQRSIESYTRSREFIRLLNEFKDI